MSMLSQSETSFAFGARRARREERIALLRFTMAKTREIPLRIPIVHLKPNLGRKRLTFSFQTISSSNEKNESR